MPKHTLKPAIYDYVVWLPYFKQIFIWHKSNSEGRKAFTFSLLVDSLTAFAQTEFLDYTVAFFHGGKNCFANLKTFLEIL